MAPGTCVAAIPDLPDAYKPPPRHRRPTLVLLAPISLCLPPQIPLLLDLRHGRVVGVAVADGLLAARDHARGTVFVAYFERDRAGSHRDTRCFPVLNLHPSRSPPPSPTPATSAAPKPLNGPPCACSTPRLPATPVRLRC
ncbi:uncharacterized protein [Triticum aestivum]|uniref:uncharacterized protein n=1 Tax=Triticum aestivum TaxID=4565 RepID=UPI001D0339F7|nr:uncharacterized protein LOC123058319 [Triticum aestivum]